ncbi:MAG: winged helix-turn-helix transcriptional regulator [Bacteroidota bacterium]
MLDRQIDHQWRDQPQDGVADPGGKPSIGIGAAVLSNRLEQMVALGIFEKRENANKRSKIDYLLTERGRALQPVVIAIGN